MNRRPPLQRDSAQPRRRERRNRNRKKPDVLAFFRNVLMLVLIAQCMRVAFASPRLRVTEIKVHGSTRLTSTDVAQFGGVGLGQNIFRVNLVKVSDRLTKDPVIQEAVVTRDLPNTLNVDIRERQAAHQISSGGKRFDVDSEGVVFRQAKGYLQGKPVLDLPAASLPSLGAKVRTEHMRIISDCGKLAKKERLDLRHLRVDEGGELWLNVAVATDKISADGASTPGRLKVRVGRATELPEKFRDIRQALQSWPNLTAAASHLDVMCAGRPAYMKAADSGKGSNSP